MGLILRVDRTRSVTVRCKERRSFIDVGAFLFANVGEGAIITVNGVTPDLSGNVQLTPANLGAQTSLGFTPENVANKATSLAAPNNTKYPTTLAVSTALATEATARVAGDAAEASTRAAADTTEATARAAADTAEAAARAAGDADTLASANDHSDAADLLTLAAAQTYADDAVAAEAADRVAGDAGTLDAAEAYADAAVATEASARAAAILAKLEFLEVACSDETTALTTGAAKVTFRGPPYAFTLTGIRASLRDAQVSGATFTVDVLEGGVSVFSTLLTIDNTARTSVGASVPAVIADAALADDAEMTVDITQVGDGTAKGLKLMLVGHQ